MVTARVVIRYGGIPELLPSLIIEISDGRHVRTVRGSEFRMPPAVHVPQSPPVVVAAPSSLAIRMMVGRGEQDDVDTLAALAFEVPVRRKEELSFSTSVNSLRPYGWGFGSVRVAPFRPGAAPRPGDSLFVGWGGDEWPPPPYCREHRESGRPVQAT